MYDATNATMAWREALYRVFHDGSEVAPRGMKIREVLNATTSVDMQCPVVTDALRKLNYRFMIAESAWILGGRNEVEYLARYNPRMRDFSDDGVVLAGAYGVPFTYQLDWVVRKLVEDRDTRQATLTLWNRAPKASKDIPCTVALDFKIRDNKLVTQVFMRSSDVWLGLPYDIFAFTAMSYRVLERLHDFGVPETEPGTLAITAASSHLYETHWEAAVPILNDMIEHKHLGNYWLCTPGELYHPPMRTRRNSPPSLLAWLETLKDAPKNQRWWTLDQEVAGAPES